MKKTKNELAEEYADDRYRIMEKTNHTDIREAYLSGYEAGQKIMLEFAKEQDEHDEWGQVVAIKDLGKFVDGKDEN
tara:strand:- start:925 stop:1152 length:228 start_codon:yes stop_codon:yes gene_type:complete